MNRRSKAAESRACFVAVLLAGMALNAPAFASPEGNAQAVELSWARSPDADTCASSSELKRAVVARLGRDPFTEPFEQQIDGYVSRKEDKWTADLVVRSKTSGQIGKRHLESSAADCRELDQAVLLTVTLIIDPNAPLQPEPAPPATIATHQPRPIRVPAPAPRVLETLPSSRSQSRPSASDGSEPIVPPLPARLTTRDRIAQSRLLFAASATHNLLSRATYALTMRAELPLTRHFLLETAAAFYPQRVSFNQNTTVGYGLTALGVGGCYYLDRWVTLLTCASGWVGAIHAIPYRGVPDRPGDRFWANVRADLGYGLTRGLFTGELRAFGLFPVTRWRFTASAGATQWQVPWIAPGAEIALGIRLP